MTDSRFGGYASRYGLESWELDALEPDVLIALVEERVHNYRDPDRWRAVVECEQEGRAQLGLLSSNWGQVVEYLSDEYSDDLLEITDDLANDSAYAEELATARKKRKKAKKRKPK